MLVEHLAIELIGREEVQRALEGTRANLRGDRLVEPWERVVEYVSDKVREIIRQDVYWRGQLHGSIEGEVLVLGDEITGVVYSDEFYAPFQERGTNPYWPDQEALEEWAEDHDVSPFVVARAIADRGLEPKKFMELAFWEQGATILELVGDVIATVIEQEY